MRRNWDSHYWGSSAIMFQTDRQTDHNESFRTDHSLESTTWWLLSVATLWHLHSVILQIFLWQWWEMSLFTAAAPTVHMKEGGSHTQKLQFFFHNLHHLLQTTANCDCPPSSFHAAINFSCCLLHCCRWKTTAFSFSSPALAWTATAAKSGERKARVARSDSLYSPRSGEIQNTAATEQSAAEACSAIKAATIEQFKETKGGKKKHILGVRRKSVNREMLHVQGRRRRNRCVDLECKYQSIDNNANH